MGSLLAAAALPDWQRGRNQFAESDKLIDQDE